MAHPKAMSILSILCMLTFSACAAGTDAGLSSEDLFAENIESIVADIQAMYDEADADYLYEPYLHIAFADIDFDGIPEFFYGYQTMTSSHNKIWYRVYSISNRAIINSEHSPDWHTYLDDTECAFFTGSDNFIEGYYLNDNGESCFITKVIMGPVSGTWTDYAFMEYANSKLFVSTGFECDKELLPIKQVWSQVALESIENDIHKLLNEYFA